MRWRDVKAEWEKDPEFRRVRDEEFPYREVADARGEALGLTEDEVAFYDALETNDSAVKVLGDETLRTIARELVASVRANLTIDWTVREAGVWFSDCLPRAIIAHGNRCRLHII